MIDGCSHFDLTKQPAPNTPEGCEECLKMRDNWAHLCLCETGGRVGCGDTSKYKPATKHFHQTNHEIIKSKN